MGLDSAQEQKARAGAADRAWAVPGMLPGLPSTFTSLRQGKCGDLHELGGSPGVR